MSSATLEQSKVSHVDSRQARDLLLVKYTQFSFLDDRTVENEIDGDVRTMFNILLSFCCG